MGAGKRLSEYIEKQGFTKKNFCEKFEFEYNNMTSIMSEKRGLGINLLNQIHEALPKLNVHWLLYGEGNEEQENVGLDFLSEPMEGYEVKNKKEFILLELLDNEKVKEKIWGIIQEKQNNN